MIHVPGCGFVQFLNFLGYFTLNVFAYCFFAPVSTLVRLVVDFI